MPSIHELAMLLLLLLLLVSRIFQDIVPNFDDQSLFDLDDDLVPQGARRARESPMSPFNADVVAAIFSGTKQATDRRLATFYCSG